MTVAIRYVQNTMDGGDNTPSVGSTGTDSQLVAIDVTTTAGIAATANADVLKWTGSGKIKYRRSHPDGSCCPKYPHDHYIGRYRKNYQYCTFGNCNSHTSEYNNFIFVGHW